MILAVLAKYKPSIIQFTCESNTSDIVMLPSKIYGKTIKLHSFTTCRRNSGVTPLLPSPAMEDEDQNKSKTAK